MSVSRENFPKKLDDVDQVFCYVFGATIEQHPPRLFRLRSDMRTPAGYLFWGLAVKYTKPPLTFDADICVLRSLPAAKTVLIAISNYGRDLSRLESAA